MGVHSICWKIKSKANNQLYLLKTIRKTKFGKQWKKTLSQLMKFKQVDHSNAVRLYLHFRDKINFYIVKEYVEGRPLLEEYLL